VVAPRIAWSAASCFSDNGASTRPQRPVYTYRCLVLSVWSPRLRYCAEAQAVVNVVAPASARIVPDALLHQRRPKWITRIADSSLFAHCFLSPRTPLPRYIAEQGIIIPAGSSREDASFGASWARRLEKKGSNRWVERTKRFSASKYPKHYRSSRSIGMKSIDRDQARTRWWQSASARAFSRQRRHIVRHWPLSRSQQVKRQSRQPHPPALTLAPARSSPLAQHLHLPSSGSK